MTLDVQAVTTSFMGRAVVDDAQQTPLEGVTVTFLGVDGDGNSTGCAGETTTDAAGNFVFKNLPAECTGEQLIRYNGLTVSRPAGDYAGVDLHYNIIAGQVTQSPVLIHLPRIDHAEIVCIEENAATDIDYTFITIPNLSATVIGSQGLTRFGRLAAWICDGIPRPMIVPNDFPPTKKWVQIRCDDFMDRKCFPRCENSKHPPQVEPCERQSHE